MAVNICREMCPDHLPVLRPYEQDVRYLILPFNPITQSQPLHYPVSSFAKKPLFSCTLSEPRYQPSSVGIHEPAGDSHRASQHSNAQQHVSSMRETLPPSSSPAPPPSSASLHVLPPQSYRLPHLHRTSPPPLPLHAHHRRTKRSPKPAPLQHHILNTTSRDASNQTSSSIAKSSQSSSQTNQTFSSSAGTDSLTKNQQTTPFKEYIRAKRQLKHQLKEQEYRTRAFVTGSQEIEEEKRDLPISQKNQSSKRCLRERRTKGKGEVEFTCLEKMSVSEVGIFLHQIGLSKYEKVFAQGDVNGLVLTTFPEYAEGMMNDSRDYALLFAHIRKMELRKVKTKSTISRVEEWRMENVNYLK